jgi:hypothetical protein
MNYQKPAFVELPTTIGTCCCTPCGYSPPDPTPPPNYGDPESAPSCNLLGLIRLDGINC